MSIIYSTGPVENAAANASVSAWIKVLNNHTTQQVKVEITLYSLNGAKKPLADTSFTVSPLSSEYDVLDVTDVLQYEVEIRLDHEEAVQVSVWGKDANANLVAAHRFITAELQSVTSAANIRSKTRTPASHKSQKRRRT
ncbi:MAG: hypothetical protein PHD40_09100 [Syntrophomonadaceae bacterium]|nr:hypothetical protein [Syntrophomonadaceae bacterium]